MRHFYSLFINRVGIRMPGLRIRAFALHRHLQEDSIIEAHRHRWSQVLFYLAGSGRQIFSDSEIPVEPGTLVVVPPGMMHAFKRTTNRRPLCLMIDFERKTHRRNPRVVSFIPHSDLMQIRQQLTYILRQRSDSSETLGWESAAIILQLLITLLREAGWLERGPVLTSGAPDSALHRLLASMDLTLPLQRVILQSGYQRDHLNRLVKKETGLSLGQFRSQQRLIKAKELLAHGVKVSNVAAEVGLPDQSYFARWFRVQTGNTPSIWVNLKKTPVQPHNLRDLSDRLRNLSTAVNRSSQQRQVWPEKKSGSKPPNGGGEMTMNKG
jgi:AraC family transcriptional regulator, transcriptional activator of pobA